MTYNEFITNIINTRGQWNIAEDEYYEVHHIVPKCMGGEPKRYGKTTQHENLIWLLPEEHYLAHKMLAEEYPEEEGLQYAWWMMCNDGKHEFTAEDYAEAKKRMSEGKKGNHPSTEFKKGQKAWNKGKHPSKETRKKMSEAKKGKPAPNKGKHPSKETRKKMSEALKGHKGWNRRPVICVETGQVFSTTKEAAEWVNSQNIESARISIIQCCQGKIKSAYGYHWKYYEED